MTLSTDNPYYFYQDDEDLYIKKNDNAYEIATPGTYTAGSTQLYVKHTVFTVGQSSSTDKYIPWNGTPTLNETKNTYYVPAGTVKTMEGDKTSVELPKDDGNNTNTAANYLVSVFTGADRDTSGNYIAVMYLGNNGELDIPVYGTLAVTKDFTVESGYSLPDNATASFTITFKDDQGRLLNGEYSAIIRDKQGHPVDPNTHAVVSTAEAAGFKLSNDHPAFTLRDDETLRVTGLPNNSTYQVVEAGEQGYKATVTNNNDLIDSSFERGLGGSTAAPAASTEGGDD